MHKSKKEEVFIKQPFFEGGPKALTSYIQAQIVYPEEALKNKTKGVVELYITIDHLGSVTDTVVLKSLGYGCDEEAQRIASLVKFVVPKNPRKLKVTFHKHLRVTFVLPKIKTPPVPVTTVNYTYTTVESPAKKPLINGNYNYSIIIKK